MTYLDLLYIENNLHKLLSSSMKVLYRKALQISVYQRETEIAERLCSALLLKNVETANIYSSFLYVCIYVTVCV